MPLISTVNGKIFPAESNETLLDAALRANVILEHSCKTGRCGSCKSKIISGNTFPIIDESSLTSAEKLSGWILTCARGAVDDIQLMLEDLSEFNLTSAKTYPARIKSLEKLAPDVMEVVLRLPPQQSIDYRPGQYIDVIGLGGIRRSYSIANAPTAEKTIELHIRQVMDGVMSKYWFEQAKPNDLLRLNGPLGTFFLRDVAGIDLILMATGTGIAPIKAILESLKELDETLRPCAVHVFWGGRIPSDFYLNPLNIGMPCNYVPVLSRADKEWQGYHGYIQQAVLISKINLMKARVYACGSSAMIDSARCQLIDAGLESKNFYSDAFVLSS